MDKYEIIITDDAVKELDDICEYIADVLQAPKSALAYLKVIREAINKLETYPQRIAVVSEAPWGDYGVRRIVVKNFYIYFYVDMETNKVYILNVIYARRDQLKALQNMFM